MADILTLKIDIEAFEKDIHSLASAVAAAQSLSDMIALDLLYARAVLKFWGSNRGPIDTVNLERIVDAALEFSASSNSVLAELLNRPGQRQGFSRNLFGLLPSEIRRLPRGFRRDIANLPHEALRPIAYAARVSINTMTQLQIIAGFDLSPAQAVTLLQMSRLTDFAIKSPRILLNLPESLQLQLLEADSTEAWFSRSHSLFRELAGDRQAVIIDIGRAEGLSRVDVLRSLLKAVREKNSTHVRDASRAAKEYLWFFSSTERRNLPSIDFERFDGSLNMSSVLRAATRSTINYDSRQYAAFDPADGGSRIIVRLPSSCTSMTSAPTLVQHKEYETAPLRFAMHHKREFPKSQLSSLLRNEIDQLEITRRNISLEAFGTKIENRLVSMAHSSAAAVPEAALAAGVYFLVARQLGISDAPTVAALEGFVHLIIRSLKAEK